MAIDLSFLWVKSIMWKVVSQDVHSAASCWIHTHIHLFQFLVFTSKKGKTNGETKSNKAQIKTKKKITAVKASTDNNTSL